jgi:3-deoxy-D-manno-octulosonate 8-phosphate phosphatase (KDO 8-P phosphatase)
LNTKSATQKTARKSRSLTSRASAGERPGATRRPALSARLAGIKLFLCDVDGILTDASIFVGGGIELKRFNIQDGLGLRLLQHTGIKVGWISNRLSAATTQRAAELKIDFLSQSNGNKVFAAEEILAQTGVEWGEVCYAGDDVVDLSLLKRVGVAIAVPNGGRETKNVAHYVTSARGGDGAVREIVELILKAQNKWDRVVQEIEERSA